MFYGLTALAVFIVWALWTVCSDSLAQEFEDNTYDPDWMDN